MKKRRGGVEPPRVTPGRHECPQASHLSSGLEFDPPGLRSNATPHQTHAITAFELLMISSCTTAIVLPTTIARRVKPNPNEISISASIRAFTPKSDEAFHASNLWASEALTLLSEVHRLVSTWLPNH